MNQLSPFLPEGSLLESPQNVNVLRSESALREAMQNGQRLEARVRVCDGSHNLHVDLPCMHGLIPRAEGAIGITEGTTRDISHPSDRFYIGQEIRVMVKGFENGRVLLTHKELLGTWEENAACFTAGETVAGIIRSVEDYGIFVELAPNLAGLADVRSGIRMGQHASVYIKSIVPERMKIKLAIVDVFDEECTPPLSKRKIVTNF